MLQGKRETFRDRIRAETASDHERLDQRMNRLDIATRPGLLRFLRVHGAAFRALSEVAEDPLLSAWLDDLCRRVDSDREQLGDTRDLPALSTAPLDTLATRYILLGSRMGTRVLRKRWEASEDPEVRSCTAYFKAPDLAGEWREFRSDLTAIPANSPRADAIIEDARTAFTLFGRALDAEIEANARQAAND